MLLAAGLVFGGALFSQAQKDREPKRPVDVKAEAANRYPELEENAIVLTGDVVFHHNGMVISCDSAVRFSDRRIDCFMNVIINKDSTYIYGDHAQYNGDLNLVRVFSPVIKIIDGDATLYTYNFTFNTLDNLGIYYGGGVLYQNDNVMESERGYYYSDMRELVAVRDVELKNERYLMNGDSVRYNMDTKVASFYSRSLIWTADGEILTADRGRYHTRDSAYFFYGNSYVLTDFRETWADTIDYNAQRRDALLYGNIQINDDENRSAAFGDFGQYWGERGETVLSRRPSLINFNEDNNSRDTIYMRADTIFMFVIYPSDRRRDDSGKALAKDPHAHLKWVDTLPDSVRLSMADSLRPVISRLRGEADRLRRRADSIMNALYPPAIPQVRKPMETQADAAADRTVAADSLPPPDGIPEAMPETGDSETDAAAITGTAPEQKPEPEPEERSRRRSSRGPNPGEAWFGSDTASLRVPVPPTAIDSLSAMEKVMELLPDSLSDRDASSLLEMLDGEIPESLSRLAADSIDVAALRSVIESSIGQDSGSDVKTAPEKQIPPEVAAMRRRVEELTAEADSLRTAEAYIRPKPKPVAPDVAAGPEIVLPEPAPADTLAPDSPAVHDKKAAKLLLKAEKKRLKAEKQAEKQRLRAEKQAEKDAKTAKKQAERRAKLIARGRLEPDSLLAERVSRLDSLAAADSLAVADSLLKARVDSIDRARPAGTEPDTTERIVRGWRDVRIWRRDMQAVCDSIVAFSRDSTVRLYTDPILWQGESQIVSDSMTLFMANGAVERAEFHGNPIMGLRLGTGQFNQVTGRSMTSRFRDNQVYRHDVFGNAEAFYYIQEDNDPTPVAFVALTASNITFKLEDRLVRFITARENVVWPVYPIEQIPPGQPTELKGFKWLEERRPELGDVFDRTIRPSEREYHEGLPRPEFPIAARINRRREYLIENRLWADRVDPLPVHAVEFVRSLQGE